MYLLSEETARDEAKTRRCLMCQEDFPSAHAGERICRRCRESAAWKRG